MHFPFIFLVPTLYNYHSSLRTPMEAALEIVNQTFVSIWSGNFICICTSVLVHIWLARAAEQQLTGRSVYSRSSQLRIDQTRRHTYQLDYYWSKQNEGSDVYYLKNTIENIFADMHCTRVIGAREDGLGAPKFSLCRKNPVYGLLRAISFTSFSEMFLSLSALFNVINF